MPSSTSQSDRPDVEPVSLRHVLAAGDARAIREVVASTGMFTPEEVEVAVELAEANLADGDASDYWFTTAVRNDRLIAYACYGPIPCTVGSFDLYWIAVHRAEQGCGLGGVVLRDAEARIRQAGGARIFIDTASRTQYAPTRRFYEKSGYTLAARLTDFYTPGDDKVVYAKVLGGA